MYPFCQSFRKHSAQKPRHLGYPRVQPFFWAIFLATLLLGATSWAEVRLPAIFGDHMVLQQDSSLPVWGWAEPGETVTVSAAGQKATTVADKDGKWQVKLTPIPAATQPMELAVAGKNTITLQDVLIGDVWICAGQSNMEFPLSNTNTAATEIPAANFPQIRLFTVRKKIALEPQSDCGGKWELCTPETAKAFSAVGYFFGKELHQTFGRPMGLIGSYWGGTNAEAWISPQGLEFHVSLKYYLDQVDNIRTNFAQLKEKYEKETLPAWQKALDAWNAKNQPQGDPKANAARPPSKPIDPTSDRNIPTALHHGMITPLIPYAIKGTLWYQGEGNCGKAAEYRTLFPALIANWRKSWGQGDFPFLFVQLASYGTGSGGSFPGVREAQLMALSQPKTAMAVAIDVGQFDNIHPASKIDVGHRLALTAQHVAYGKDLVYSGPIYKSMKVEANKIRISFERLGSGLTIAAPPATQPGAPPATPAATLTGFTIAGADKAFVPAQATIEGDTVVASSDQVQRPVAVRYAWAGFPEVNLYNKELLPASPFRTDDWNLTSRPDPKPTSAP